MLKVRKGSFIPADRHTQERLRDRGYKQDEIIAAQLRKARNPAYHRLAHAFGQVLTDNLEGFEGLDAHKALKRIQFEANIACDEFETSIQTKGTLRPARVTIRIPRSLSYDDMGQEEFESVYAAMCRHVAETYWPDLKPEEIAVMAELMPDRGNS